MKILLTRRYEWPAGLAYRRRPRGPAFVALSLPAPTLDLEEDGVGVGVLDSDRPGVRDGVGVGVCVRLLGPGGVGDAGDTAACAGTMMLPTMGLVHADGRTVTPTAAAARACNTRRRISDTRSASGLRGVLAEWFSLTAALQKRDIDVKKSTPRLPRCQVSGTAAVAH